MTRQELADRIVHIRSKRAQRRLLVENREIADCPLAREIQSVCYSLWTSEPVSARNARSAIASLSELNGDPEIEAIRHWIAGIALITEGSLEDAVTELRAATAAFKRLKMALDSAQPMVAELIALAMLGIYPEALKTGRKALKIFESNGDDLAAGKIELNLSNIASRQEHHREAERFGLAALQRFTALGEISWRTMAENSLANTYAELNDLDRAEEYYIRARENAELAGMTVTVAEIEASLGNLELTRGRYADALGLFEASRRKYDELSMPHQTAIANLEIADIYLELNLAAEAAEMYRSIAPVLKKLRLRAEEARARRNFGRAAVKTGRISIARRELQRAIKLFEQEENPIAAATADLDLAKLEFDSGKLGSAALLISAAKKRLARSENPRPKLAADWLDAEVLLARDSKRARIAFEQLVERANELQQLGYVQASYSALGKIDLKSGDLVAARYSFEKAVSIVERLRAPLPAEEFRIAFMAERLEPYKELVKIAISENRIDEALVWSERTRSRSLSDSIADTGSLPNGDPMTGEMSRLRDQLNRYYKRLDETDVEDPSRIDRTIVRLEKRIATLSRRLQSITSKGAGRRTPDFVRNDIARIHRHLGDDRALVEFVESDGMISAFAAVDDKVRYFGALASKAEIEALVKSLRFQFESLKYGERSVAAILQVLKKRTDHYLTTLYDKILKPLEQALGSRDLVVIPAGPLHYLPFHAFKNEARYLIEDRLITYAPSASVWLQLQRDQSPEINSALLVAYADEKIPLAEAEVRSIKDLFPKAAVLCGKEATFSAYLEASGGKDLIHLACHGGFRADDPMSSSLHLANGWVTVNDVCRQRLGAKLVTLSACETGRSEVAAGEELLGLARGFLSAGAANIVISLWTVNDAATAGIMKDFYAEIKRGSGFARALQAAQKKRIALGEHPYFWAPFLMIGS
jgi:CHAT domain-containing protein